MRQINIYNYVSLNQYTINLMNHYIISVSYKMIKLSQIMNINKHKIGRWNSRSAITSRFRC